MWIYIYLQPRSLNGKWQQSPMAIDLSYFTESIEAITFQLNFSLAVFKLLLSNLQTVLLSKTISKAEKYL